MPYLASSPGFRPLLCRGLRAKLVRLQRNCLTRIRDLQALGTNLCKLSSGAYSHRPDWSLRGRAEESGTIGAGGVVPPSRARAPLKRLGAGGVNPTGRMGALSAAKLL